MENSYSDGGLLIQIHNLFEPFLETYQHCILSNPEQKDKVLRACFPKLLQFVH